MTIISNWGNTPKVDAKIFQFHTLEQLKEIIGHSNSLIARGMGRCYGDSALNDTIVSTTDFKQIKQLDTETGQLLCESGVTLKTILETIVPLGWFLPVTPGTKFVTIGGAVAADVHGKNHHNSGSISNFVQYIDILTSDATVIRCSKKENQTLFENTCGGMGLTGIITEVCLQLIPIKSAYIRQQTICANNLDEIMDLFSKNSHWTYSVAWIDCLAKGRNIGKSVLMLGEHAQLQELNKKQKKKPLELKPNKTLSVPFFLPQWVLNSWTVRAFNALYFRKHPKIPTTSIVGFDSFFYPLDKICNWNRMYGKKGFTQYQCVFPLDSSKKALYEILNIVAQTQQGSFLAVLKQLGKQSNGISFAMEGYTLTLDFPMNKKTLLLLPQLDRVVEKYGGRINLSKDCRMPASLFQNSYQNVKQFVKHKHQFDPKNMFQSHQSKRLEIRP